MKPIIDIKQTLGDKFILIKQPIDWTDFNDNSKILGSVIEVGVVEKFEKITVKIPVRKEKIDIETGSNIDLTNLSGTLYIKNNYINISWKADNILESQEQNGFNFQ